MQEVIEEKLRECSMLQDIAKTRLDNANGYYVAAIIDELNNEETLRFPIEQVRLAHEDLLRAENILQKLRAELRVYRATHGT